MKATRRCHSETTRDASVIVGILFIIGTVAGISSGIVTGPVLGDSDYTWQQLLQTKAA